jgi:hypothetical protein
VTEAENPTLDSDTLSLGGLTSDIAEMAIDIARKFEISLSDAIRIVETGMKVLLAMPPAQPIWLPEPQVADEGLPLIPFPITPTALPQQEA